MTLVSIAPILGDLTTAMKFHLSSTQGNVLIQTLVWSGVNSYEFQLLSFCTRRESNERPENYNVDKLK